MPDSIPQLLTLTEVAEKLRVSGHTVRSWVRQGRLKPVRICRRLLFSPDCLRQFLAENADQPRRQTTQGSDSEM